MKINSSLAKYPSQFFGDLFIFNWYQARQHFENRDFAAERTINRSELHAHSPGPYDDQRLGNFLERQDFDVGENAVIRLKAWEHARLPTSRENYILRFNMARPSIIRNFDCMHPVQRRAGHLAISANRLHLLFLHQEYETLGVLGHDFRVAYLVCSMIQLELRY